MTNKTQKKRGGNLQSVVAQLLKIINLKEQSKEQMPLVKKLSGHLKQNPRDLRLLISVDINMNPNTNPNEKYDDVPILCIILKHVSNIDAIKSFITNYDNNGGDLELESKTHKLTGLSFAKDKILQTMINRKINQKYFSAVELPGELHDFINYRDNIKSSDTEYYTPRTRERIVPSHSKTVRKPRSKEKPRYKSMEKSAEKTIELNLSETEPTEYDPDFWEQFLDDNTVSLFRNMNCDTIQSFFAGYQTTDCKYTMRDGLIRSYMKSDCDKINQIFCITFLVLGFLSHRLRNSDYTIVFKGGKAIQMMYPQSNYKSDDIDIVLVSKNGYEPKKMKSFACHIGYLLTHISGTILNLSVEKKKPRPEQTDEFNEIVKVSINHQGFIPILDIDFSNSPNYLTNNISQKKTINEMKLLFRHPSEKSMLDDKLKYFIHYEDLKFREKTDKYDYYISKFKRAILEIGNHMKKKTLKEYISEYVKAKFTENEFVIGVAGRNSIIAKILKLLNIII